MLTRLQPRLTYGKSVAATIALFGVLATLPAAAAARTTVELTHPNQPAFWSGGPVSGVAAPEACGALACDEVDLRVDLPAGLLEKGGVQVAIRWEDESQDLDLYVYDPDGSVAAESTGIVSTAESVLIVPSENGEYRVVVVPSGAEEVHYEGLVQYEREIAKRPPRELLPDLVSLPARQPQIRTGAYLAELPASSSPTGCYPEETLEKGARRCLRFDQIIANVGSGPFEIRYRLDGLGTTQDLEQRIYRSDGSYRDRSADTYEFHPAHAHFHYANFARAHLWRSNAAGERLGAEPVSSGRKNGFCMVDFELHWWGRSGDAPRTYIPPNCLLPTDLDPEDGRAAAVNGISVGWADVYKWYLADQFIEISDVPDGFYLIESVADPADTAVEESDANNSSTVHIRLCGKDAEVVGNAEPCPG